MNILYMNTSVSWEESLEDMDIYKHKNDKNKNNERSNNIFINFFFFFFPPVV